MQAKRASITGDRHINGTELANALGIGRSTLSRWIGAASGAWLIEGQPVDRCLYC